MDRDAHLRKLRYRAWHRGTKEADMLIGGFFDRHHAEWGEEQMRQFEGLLEEQDVDIMAWAIGTAEAPRTMDANLIRQLRKLNYIEHLR